MGFVADVAQENASDARKPRRANLSNQDVGSVTRIIGSRTACQPSFVIGVQAVGVEAGIGDIFRCDTRHFEAALQFVLWHAERERGKNGVLSRVEHDRTLADI